MDIVVKGRNVEVPAHYQQHVDEKLSRLDRYDRKAMRADVELRHERNPRQAKNCQRVEITLKGRGPAVRAEASAMDFYAALDAASTKLENRLRKMHDRRKVHYGRRNPRSVAEATSAMADRPVAVAGAGGTSRAQSRTTLLEPPTDQLRDDTARGNSTVNDSAVSNKAASSKRTSPGSETLSGGTGVSQRGTPRQGTPRQGTPGEGVPQQREDSNDYEPGRIVREKEHPATPMTVDQALYEMELVGHDFYLFFDADADKPSVVYRRRGFDYGVIRLA